MYKSKTEDMKELSSNVLNQVQNYKKVKLDKPTTISKPFNHGL